MSRHRWLRIEWHDNAMQSIIKGMIKNEFKTESPYGFRLEKARSDYIDGRYIEHQRYLEEVKDPFGNTIEIPRESYVVVHFKISNTFPNLEFEDPPRNINNVLTRIASATDFKMSITPIVIDLCKWMKIIQKITDKISVVELSLSGITLNQDTSAEVKISGKYDVREQLKLMMREYVGLWDKLKIEGVSSGNKFKFAINRNACAHVSGPGSNEILDVIRKSLNLYNP